MAYNRAMTDTRDTQPSGVGAEAPICPEDLFRHLEALGIAFETHHHDPVFTVEEARSLRGALPGAHVKNLFLRDKKKRYWLVVVEELRPIALKALAKKLGAGTFSFGSPERLFEVLGVRPGSVTPLALINAKGRHQVNVVFDSALMDEALINCHPLLNTMTTSLAVTDLMRFIEDCGFSAEPMELANLDVTA